MAGAVPRRYGTLPRAHGCTVGQGGKHGLPVGRADCRRWQSKIDQRGTFFERHDGLEAWASH